jgi:hypothetical protein
MEVKYKSSFIKDFNKVKSKKEQEKIYKICFKDILEVKSISEIRNLKKIKAYDHILQDSEGKLSNRL